jgi:hypothetical protein
MKAPQLLERCDRVKLRHAASKAAIETRRANFLFVTINLLPALTVVAQVGSSNKNTDERRDAKDDSYAKRSIINPHAM